MSSHASDEENKKGERQYFVEEDEAPEPFLPLLGLRVPKQELVKQATALTATMPVAPRALRSVGFPPELVELVRSYVFGAERRVLKTGTSIEDLFDTGAIGFLEADGIRKEDLESAHTWMYAAETKDRGVLTLLLSKEDTAWANSNECRSQTLTASLGDCDVDFTLWLFMNLPFNPMQDYRLTLYSGAHEVEMVSALDERGLLADVESLLSGACELANVGLAKWLVEKKGTTPTQRHLHKALQSTASDSDALSLYLLGKCNKEKHDFGHLLCLAIMWFKPRSCAFIHGLLPPGQLSFENMLHAFYTVQKRPGLSDRGTLVSDTFRWICQVRTEKFDSQTLVSYYLDALSRGSSQAAEYFLNLATDSRSERLIKLAKSAIQSEALVDPDAKIIRMVVKKHGPFESGLLIERFKRNDLKRIKEEAIRAIFVDEKHEVIPHAFGAVSFDSARLFEKLVKLASDEVCRIAFSGLIKCGRCRYAEFMASLRPGCFESTPDLPLLASTFFESLTKPPLACLWLLDWFLGLGYKPEWKEIPIEFFCHDGYAGLVKTLHERCNLPLPSRSKIRRLRGANDKIYEMLPH